MVIAAATETPRGERSHAVGAHVAECPVDWLEKVRGCHGMGFQAVSRV
jgi:hypothetical protein